MGMNFFVMDGTTRKIIVSPQLWIYVCVSFPLAILTFLIWKWNAVETVYRRRRPKVPHDIETLRSASERTIDFEKEGCRSLDSGKPYKGA